ncbi:isoprenyl transferase [Rubritalea marina]|uniref:isoprenyl transferase n=1 Tax=Rubritalea marina TaxID=361055 RepID=UPI0003773642|nr:isoprenyl transferase [Rubritalea marina]
MTQELTPKPPRHIAIIMDGNGRWAQQRGLPRVAGHRAGAEAVRRTVDACIKSGVEVITLYAFSSENWSRPESEVKALMQLLDRFLKEKTKEMMQQNVKLQAIGRLDKLPEKTRKRLEDAIQTTANNTALTVNLALSYSGRDELTDATKAIAQQVAAGELEVDAIDADTITSNLYTHGLPDPELLIRTSGEFRLSNFLLWQLSYTEIIIFNKFWPDFDESDVLHAIEQFHSRDRRFGTI